jgi:hypothetical protein
MVIGCGVRGSDGLTSLCRHGRVRRVFVSVLLLVVACCKTNNRHDRQFGSKNTLPNDRDSLLTGILDSSHYITSYTYYDEVSGEQLGTRNKSCVQLLFHRSSIALSFIDRTTRERLPTSNTYFLTCVQRLRTLWTCFHPPS